MLLITNFRTVPSSSYSSGSRIFLKGAPTPKVSVLTYFFAESYMKMNGFGPMGWGREGGASLVPPLEIRQ